ncbi:MAG: alpha/beta hydrolase [Selenomonadaceae bacterium]|nr:alpha/beta hydrolase [Selenomonadaceae bacterium]
MTNTVDAAKIPADATAESSSTIQVEKLKLEKNWDKVFPKSDKVNHQKVTFVNRYGITLAADMYTPKNYTGKLPALAISGPFGAVKEQSSGLYAQEMAERGFLTIAFDPSFTGESGGYPRFVASPDINTEDFSAAVDFLSNLDNVDKNKIGIIGICGWGGIALNAAAIDTRIKATVATTMYDMSRVMANGYFDYDKDAETLKRERMQNRINANNQRTADYKAGKYTRAGGVVEDPSNFPQFVKDYYTYYKTDRGYHKRSLNSNAGWNATTALSFMNMPQLSYISEIENPVLIIHGENAHSRYFSETAFENMTGVKRSGLDTVAGNKELLIIPGANHIDLYDNFNAIPFDKIESFFKANLR